MERLHISNDELNRLKEKMIEYRKSSGPLMPTLHYAQSTFGCIPRDIQKVIANGLGVSIARVNGVVSFYAQFSEEPKGKNIIGVCLGTACYVKGAQDILDKIGSKLEIKPSETTKDGKFTLEQTRCVGACSLAPVMMVNDEAHGKLDSSKATDVIETV